MARPLKLLQQSDSLVTVAPRRRSSAPDRALNEFLDYLDPLGNSENSDAVRFALAASNHSRFSQFWECLCNSRFRHYSLAAIAKRCDLTLAELQKWWQDAQVQRAIYKAQDAVIRLVDDLGRDSRTVEAPCDRCDALGVINQDTKESKEKTRVCPACKGTGKGTRMGDAGARKMLTEISGHTGARKGRAAVQIVQSYGIEARADKLSQIKFDMD